MHAWVDHTLHVMHITPTNSNAIASLNSNAILDTKLAFKIVVLWKQF